MSLGILWPNGLFASFVINYSSDFIFFCCVTQVLFRFSFVLALHVQTSYCFVCLLNTDCRHV